MPIYSPTGFLDITNATLRTSNTECQNLKIGTGNLYVTSEISPSFELNLSNVTSLGATSPHTLTLSNVTTAIDATSNIITSGNLKIGGLIYTKDWGIRGASGSNDLYVGRFTVHGITEVLITDQGASLGSASKFTITRNVSSTPLVNGIDSSSTINYEWYFESHDSTTYDLWVHPTAAVQTNIKVTSSTYIPVDAPTSPTLIPCANGLINMSGNVVASQNLTISGNTFYTSPMSVSVDSNVVTEYTGPHDRPLRKYPEVALTSATTGEYTASQSSENDATGNFSAWKAFDSSEAPNGTLAITQSSQYNNTSGTLVYTGDKDLLGDSNYKGEWIKLELPISIAVKKIHLQPRTTFFDQTPCNFKIVGSNDNSSWDVLYHNNPAANTTIPSDTEQVHHMTHNLTKYYKYVALVANTTGAPISGNYMTMSVTNIEYYGHEEGSGSLDTTLKTVYNVPATTGTQLEVYYDAKGESTVQSPIPDLSPNTNTGAVVGHSPTLDETDGIDSFKFNGSSQYITSTHGLSVPGQPVHSQCVWFKITGDTSDYQYISIIGTSNPTNQAGLILLNDGTTLLGNYYGGDRVITTITQNVWYHVVLVYTGTTTDAAKYYINGVEVITTGLSGAAPITPTITGTTVRLGANTAGGQELNGSIANFRLYSKALNAGQVKELYDYQKDYFLGSKSQVTLYKGHLGVGVTEPSGQLELAGDERIQEYPPRDLYQYETLVEGHGVFCASASIEFNDDNHPPWEAFSDSATSASQESVWTTDGALYHTTSGLYTGSTTTAGIKGEWIQLKTPYKIKVSSFNLNSYAVSVNSNRQPKDFTLLGSSDGNDWEQMKSVAGQAKSGYTGVPSTYSGPLGPHYTINSTKYYSYFRIVVTANQGGDALVGISRIRFFGTPGPTTLDKGSLTLGRSLDVPRISRYDVDTETPRPEKLVVDFDTTVNSSPTDISGKGNHGIYHGTAQYSPADKAFKFDGNSDWIQTTATGTSGNFIHSVSMWVKSEVPSTSTTSRTAFHMGNASVANQEMQIQFNYNSNGTVYLGTQSGWLTMSNMEDVIKQNQWHHIAYTYNGTNMLPENTKFYIDGKQMTMGNGSSSTLSFPSSTEDVFLGRFNSSGSQNWWDGQISNFKLYNVALEPSEVQKLYRLGRTGRFMVISDTAVGIGKVPEAQLDVRGNLTVSGQVTRTYNPGEIIEELNTVCNGRSVTVQSGTYTPTNVTARQDSTSTHTEINGSFITYNKPAGAKRIYYKFACQWNDAWAGAITAFKIRIFHDSSWRDIYPSRHAHAAQYRSDANNHGATWVINEYIFECDASSDSEHYGRFTSSKNSYTFDVTWRHHGGAGSTAYNSVLHRLDFFDGDVNNNPIHPPQLTIRAIA